MAKYEKRKLSEKDPRLEIDLNKLFGSRVPDSDTFREGVGQAIIDAIRARTNKNIDRRDKRFQDYSKSYAKTLEFKSAGKKKGDPNLRLTGDMLGFMDIIDSTKNTIVIGWSSREEQLKAHGHITGSKRGPRVRRDFFGLPDDSYEKITSGFTLPKSEPAADEASTLSTLLTLKELFDG